MSAAGFWPRNATSNGSSAHSVSCTPVGTTDRTRNSANSRPNGTVRSNSSTEPDTTSTPRHDDETAPRRSNDSTPPAGKASSPPTAGSQPPNHSNDSSNTSSPAQP